MEQIFAGTWSSFLAGLGTLVGALGVFLIRSMSRRTEEILLSSAAGVMLSASVFSLLLPALESARKTHTGAGAAELIVALGIAGGAVGLYLIHRFVPHEHFGKGREGPAGAFSRIWLFVLAITLHNLPEGMAVGVGNAAAEGYPGLSLAIGIWIQNIPEGLAVAVSLRSLEFSRMRSFAFASLTGLVEPLGGFLGSAAVQSSSVVLPFALAIAAGAMLFVISDEIIPETHRESDAVHSTFSLLAGFTLMMLLDGFL